MKTRFALAWMSAMMVAGCGLLIGLEDRELPLESPDATNGPDGTTTNDGAPDTSTGDSGDAGKDADAAKDDADADAAFDAGVDACTCTAGCNPEGLCLDEIIGLTMGRNHQCHVRGDGKLFCLGDNAFGQLGNAGGDSTTFVQVTVAGGTPAFRDVASGGRSTCAISRDRDLYCWGQNHRQQLGNDGGAIQLPKKVELGGLKVKSVSVGSHTTCAIVDIVNGPNIRCWGNAANGELGTGLDPNDGGAGLVTVPDPTTVKNLRAKAVHVVDNDSLEGGRVCALAELDGAPYCWGATDAAEISNAIATTCNPSGGAVKCALEPTSFDTTKTVAIGNGVNGVCAVQEIGGLSNRVFCRGTTNNFISNSICGAPAGGYEVTLPQDAGSPLGLFSTVSHRCFTNALNELWCFGSNGTFQMLRAGSDTCGPLTGPERDRRPSSPLQITLLADGGNPANDPTAGVGIPIKVKLVSVGQFNVLVYTPEKKLIGWGANHEGQLGPALTAIAEQPFCSGVSGACQGVTVIPQPAFP